MATLEKASSMEGGLKRFWKWANRFSVCPANARHLFCMHYETRMDSLEKWRRMAPRVVTWTGTCISKYPVDPALRCL
jgi:hypothetical protein